MLSKILNLWIEKFHKPGEDTYIRQDRGLPKCAKTTKPEIGREVFAIGLDCLNSSGPSCQSSEFIVSGYINWDGEEWIHLPSNGRSPHAVDHRNVLVWFDDQEKEKK